jgi:hypothetical protein
MSQTLQIRDERPNTDAPFPTTRYIPLSDKCKQKGCSGLGARGGAPRCNQPSEHEDDSRGHQVYVERTTEYLLFQML